MLLADISETSVLQDADGDLLCRFPVAPEAVLIGLLSGFVLGKNDRSYNLN